MNINWRYVNFRGVEKPDATVFALLKPCPLIVELNLSGASLSEADLANLEGLKNLVKLNLAKSTVTDAGLAHLKGLTQLETLNLFHTGVTDAGLEQLKGLKNLEAALRLREQGHGPRCQGARTGHPRLENRTRRPYPTAGSQGGGKESPGCAHTRRASHTETGREKAGNTTRAQARGEEGHATSTAEASRVEFTTKRWGRFCNRLGRLQSAPRGKAAIPSAAASLVPQSEKYSRLGWPRGK